MKKLLLSALLLSASSFALTPNTVVCANEEVQLQYNPKGLYLKNADGEYDVSPGDIIKNPSIIGTLLSIKASDSVADIGTIFLSFVMPDVELPSREDTVPFLSIYLQSISKKGVPAPHFENGLINQVTDFKVISCVAALK